MENGPSAFAPDSNVGRLRDGTTVRIRRARPADSPRILEFLRHVTGDALRLRFLETTPPEIAAAVLLTPCSATDHVSLLMELPDRTPASVVAHGEYVRSRSDPSRAEVAFLVADDRQGQGAATLLLVDLARRARSAGIRQFDAVMRPENRAMLAVCLGAGFPCSATTHDALEHVALDISREPETGAVPAGPPGERSRVRA
jgi:GNAT superfamily N-acetyltransferase